METAFLYSQGHPWRAEIQRAFSELELSTKEQIEREVLLYKFEDCEHITQKDFFDGNRICVLLKGALSLVLRDEEGRTAVPLKITSHISEFALPTECFASFSDSVEIVCIGETELCYIPEKLSMQIFCESWRIREWKERCYIKTCSKLLETVNDLSFLPLKERLYKKLLEYCTLYQTALISVTHEQLAEELATSREVISRLLKKMEAEGRIIIRRKSIQILENR